MAPQPNQQKLLSARPTAAHDKSEPTQTAGLFEERHYSVSQLAVMWNLSEDAVRRLFRNEPGVLHLAREAKGKPHRRPYTTLRIPQSVVERVHRHHSLVK